MPTFFRVCGYILLLLWPLLATAQQTAQQQVTVNLTDMEINQLINMVSEVTHKTFIVDPRVKGKVTVISNSPIDREQLYEVFLSILSVHGFAAVPSGAVIKIVPESMAKTEDTPVLSPPGSFKGDSIITQVVQLKHVSAPQLIPLLRPLIHQEGHLVAYPNNNTLIMSDRANTVNRVLEIIARIDHPNSREIEIVVLEHASAPEVVRTLSTLEQQTATTAGSTGGVTSLPNLVADERTNSILIGGDSDSRLRLRTLIAHLDLPVKSVGNTQVIYLNYAQASNLVNVLKGVSDTMVQTEGQKTPALKEEVKTNIQADASTNSLVITATPNVLQNLRNVIRQLDVRRAQVLVEAIIAEVATDKIRELGVQWLFYGANGTHPGGFSNFDNSGNQIIDLATNAYQLSQSNAASLPKITAGAALGLGSFGSGALNFATLLQALSADVETNVLSTPTLLTLDNEEAEIVVGQNVPFVTGQYTTTGANNGVNNPFQTIQRQDVGLKLKVKPQINEGNAVKLQIEQEVSSITPSSVTTADIVTNKRTIKTTVIIEDGNMVVLGGLIDEDLQQTTQKVPGLGDIPLLGALFRSHHTKKVKRNLMVFLHPVIVREAALERTISIGKYNDMRAKQLHQRNQNLPLLPNHEVPVLPALTDFITILPPGEAISLPPKIEGKPVPVPPKNLPKGP